MDSQNWKDCHICAAKLSDRWFASNSNIPNLSNSLPPKWSEIQSKRPQKPQMIDKRRLRGLYKSPRLSFLRILSYVLQHFRPDTKQLGPLQRQVRQFTSAGTNKTVPCFVHQRNFQSKDSDDRAWPHNSHTICNAWPSKATQCGKQNNTWIRQKSINRR